MLTWKRAQDTVPWNIILLLGGGFAMAKGCEVRGAGSRQLGEVSAHPGAAASVGLSEPHQPHRRPISHVGVITAPCRAWCCPEREENGTVWDLEELAVSIVPELLILIS